MSVPVHFCTDPRTHILTKRLMNPNCPSPVLNFHLTSHSDRKVEAFTVCLSIASLDFFIVCLLFFRVSSLKGLNFSGVLILFGGLFLI